MRRAPAFGSEPGLVSPIHRLKRASDAGSPWMRTGIVAWEGFTISVCPNLPALAVQMGGIGRDKHHDGTERRCPDTNDIDRSDGPPSLSPHNATPMLTGAAARVGACSTRFLAHVSGPLRSPKSPPRPGCTRCACTLGCLSTTLSPVWYEFDDCAAWDNERVRWWYGNNDQHDDRSECRNAGVHQAGLRPAAQTPEQPQGLHDRNEIRGHRTRCTAAATNFHLNSTPTSIRPGSRLGSHPWKCC